MLLGPVRWVVLRLLRGLLALRYRVTVHGLEAARRQPGPFLLLPNHPAFVDPPIVLAWLWPAFRMRPVLLETNFRNPLLAPFAWLLRGIRTPWLTRASETERRRIEAALAEIITSLRRGENVVLWPSGHLSRDGSERLGGARMAADVLAAVPECTVVLIRTRGLWGSMFGFADREPFLFPALLRGLALWAANLFVFAPRRPVSLTLEAFRPEQRPQPTREAVNRWLEAWYNADTPRETPTYVPRHFCCAPRTHQFPPPPPPKEFDLARVRPETRAAVAQFLEARLRRPLPPDLPPSTGLAQLGLDSIDAMEVTLAVEQRFGFTAAEVPKTLGELWAVAEGLQEKPPPPPPPPGWFDRPRDDEPLSIPGETVAEAFLTQALARRKQLIVADDLAGGVTYERLLVGATALADRFAALPAPHVGLMLPASVGCDLAFLGLTLAGKLPVLLNWTTGPAHLEHAARLTGLTHVVTSRAFVDRVQVRVPGVEYVFLEDMRASVGRLELLRRLLGVRWFGSRLRRRRLARLDPDPHRPAVVLFTSGSEKAPKAVPLTHANILADQRACLEALRVGRDHAAIGFLPMFHSFGLTVTGLLPLFVGVRIVHHPDPTDAGAIVRKIAAYRPTLLAATPTFLQFLLDRAGPGDLDSLRILIVGAEKCPAHLFGRVKELAPAAELLEGYGVTECSPVVSVNRPGRNRPGTVGEPLPGVAVCVTDLETGAVLPPGRLGLLLVSGPIVFPGYWGDEGPSPFRDLDGRRWYVTGDLAELTPDGFIVFHGRLKRFLKAGGEMISLPALEEPFARLYPPTDRGPRVAVEGIELPGGGRRIVLFTTEPLTLAEANAILWDAGLRGVMRLDEVRQLDQLPVLGTGKTDYKALRALISASPDP